MPYHRKETYHEIPRSDSRSGYYPLLHSYGFRQLRSSFELNDATAEDLMNRCFFSQELADKILELRDSLGGFQSWDDLKDLKLSDAELSILHSEATIHGVAVDCNC